MFDFSTISRFYENSVKGLLSDGPSLNEWLEIASAALVAWLVVQASSKTFNLLRSAGIAIIKGFLLAFVFLILADQGVVTIGYTALAIGGVYLLTKVLRKSLFLQELFKLVCYILGALIAFAVMGSLLSLTEDSGKIDFDFKASSWPS